MKKPVFSGSGVALVTPMDSEGRVNELVLRRLIESQIEHGTDAVILCGTTGEAPTLDDREHLSAITCAAQTIRGRVPLIAGTGSNDTRHAIALSLEAKQCGADALLMVTPYYNKTSQSGLLRHYYTVADAVGMPIIVYNVPSRTGMNIQPETYKALSRYPMIAGAKEAGGNIAAAAKTKALCGDELPLYAGNDDSIVPMLSIGAVGVVSVLANVAPRRTHEICALWQAGKTEEACALQLALLPLIEALFSDVNPVPVKEALRMMGYDVGDCRLPLGELSPENREKLHRAMQEAHLLPVAV